MTTSFRIDPGPASRRLFRQLRPLLRCVGGGALLAIGLMALVATAPGTARAEEEAPKGWIDFEGRLEPARLAPGESGLLIVTGSIPDKLHVYAQDAAGNKNEDNAPLTYSFHDARGVTYKTDALEITAPHMYDDKIFETQYPVYEKVIQVRVPVSIAKDAPANTQVGVAFTYSGCDDSNCYRQRKSHTVLVSLDGSVQIANGPPGLVSKPRPKPGESPQPAPKAPGPRVVGASTGQGGSATLALSSDGKTLEVTFAPQFGWHMYMPPGGKNGEPPIEVKPVETQGVRFGTFEIPEGDNLHGPLTVKIPFTRAADALEVKVLVAWQACSDGDFGQPGQCGPMHEDQLALVWEGAASTVVQEAETPKGEVRYPVIEGDEVTAVEDQDKLGGLIAEYGYLALFFVFLFGMGLAFTPCVLPIIPITISVICGGNMDLPKRRVMTLLGIYVAGLALTYTAVGVIAALTGSGLSEAMKHPPVLWGFAALFMLLAFGMLGIFELQPPQWLSKIQGGAQRRGGSPIGVFVLGCLMALVASPCTGPFLVGMVAFTAKSGNLIFGALLFLCLGLGMGAVFFLSATSLSFLLRPGPWMVWVRYGFGVLLFGAAIYYVGSYGLADPMAQLLIALIGASLSAFLIARHLIHREGEKPQAAWSRGLMVGFFMLLGAAIVGILTRRPGEAVRGVEWTALLAVLIGIAVVFIMTRLLWPERKPAAEADAGPKPAPRPAMAISAILTLLAAGLAYVATVPIEKNNKVEFVYVKSLDHLDQLLADARSEGKAAMVDFWANTCHYCKVFDKDFAAHGELRERLDKVARIKVDLTNESFNDVFDAVGIQRGTQPALVFFDTKGRIRRAADLTGHPGEAVVLEALKNRLDLVIKNRKPPARSTETGSVKSD